MNIIIIAAVIITLILFVAEMVIDDSCECGKKECGGKFR